MGKCTEAVLEVGQVCPELAARRVNFFSGRLLAADDLRQEQSALSQRDRWLGSALGAGVARGLQVSRATAGKGYAANLLRIEAGLAINDCGEALALDRMLNLRLAPAVEKSGVGGFAPCGDEAGFVMDQGEGYYLISLAPAIGLSGEKAREIGRDGQLIACGARWRLEGISLQVDKIPAAALPSDLRGAPPAGDAKALSRARSRLAKLCLGDALGPTPLGSPADDLLCSAKLAQAERVPLAIVAWNSAGIAFVDRWAVRRSPAPETSNLSDFPYWPPGARRAMQAEAMQRQFQEHLAEVLQAGAATAAGMAAGDWFLWLPSVGILTRQDSDLGLSAKAFFAGLPTRALFLARAALEKLLRDGMAYPPIDLTLKTRELNWLY